MTAIQTPVRIVLIDDHTLLREGLRRLLEAGTRFTIVAEASTTKQALDITLSSLEFDLALIDYELDAAEQDGNGLIVLRSMRQHRPRIPCMIVTAGIDARGLSEVIDGLKASVFFKSEPTSELILAIEMTLLHEQWISPQASLALLRNKAEEEQEHHSGELIFSPRELRVLSYITHGLSNKEIACELELSESSVKAMLQKLFAKTSVRSRSQLVRFVFESEMALP